MKEEEKYTLKFTLLDICDILDELNSRINDLEYESSISLNDMTNDIVELKKNY